MRIKHYTLLFAFLAIFMGIPLIQGCRTPWMSMETEERK